MLDRYTTSTNDKITSTHVSEWVTNTKPQKTKFLLKLNKINYMRCPKKYLGGGGGFLYEREGFEWRVVTSGLKHSAWAGVGAVD